MSCNVIKKETPSQVFSCQFCEIFKNIFFIEHLRWLLLPILKPLNSQGQLCKWISKLVTIYFISTFLVLVGIFVFIFGEHKLYFYISTVMRLRKCISVQYDFYLIRRDLALETFRNKFSYLNHFIITSKYKFSYWWKELIIVMAWL